MTWLTLLAAAAATQVLRLGPLLAYRLGGGIPPRWRRGLEAAGLATIGSLLAAAVFSGPLCLAQSGPRLLALLLGFVLYLWLRRGLVSLLLAHGAYVLLLLAIDQMARR